MRLTTSEDETRVVLVNERACRLHQLVDQVGTAMRRFDRHPLADEHAFRRNLVKERLELILLDLARRETAPAPRQATRCDHLVAVTRVEQPAVAVFRFGKQTLVCPRTITTELPDVHLEAQTLNPF